MKKTIAILSLSAALFSAQAQITSSTIYGPVTISCGDMATPSWPWFHVTNGVFGATITNWYPLGVMQSEAVTVSGFLLTNGNFRLMPWYSGAGGNVVQFAVRCGISISTETNNLRVGLYEALPSLFPGALLWESGSFQVQGSPGSTQTNYFTTTTTLKPNTWYWSVAQTDGTNVNINCNSASAQFVSFNPLGSFNFNEGQQVSLECVTNTFAAFPATFPGLPMIGHTTAGSRSWAVTIFARF